MSCSAMGCGPIPCLAAWTVGSIFRGALEIYGTTHALTLVYPAAGALLCAAALATQIGSQINKP